MRCSDQSPKVKSIAHGNASLHIYTWSDVRTYQYHGCATIMEHTGFEIVQVGLAATAKTIICAFRKPHRHTHHTTVLLGADRWILVKAWNLLITEPGNHRDMRRSWPPQTRDQNLVRNRSKPQLYRYGVFSSFLKRQPLILTFSCKQGHLWISDDASIYRSRLGLLLPIWQTKYLYSELTSQPHSVHTFFLFYSCCCCLCALVFGAKLIDGLPIR
jgi:hypothetical protein